MVRTGHVPLVGVLGIGRLLGVPPDMVRAWHRQYPDFPQPRPSGGGEPRWDVSEVERWARSWGWRGEPAGNEVAGRDAPHLGGLRHSADEDRPGTP